MKLNVGGGLQGAAQGGTIGYTAGGPAGGAIGAGVGGVYGLLGGGQNKPEKLRTFDPRTAEQRNYANQLLQNAGSQNSNALDYLNQILSDDPNAFKAFENNAMTNFQQKILPAIAERFAGGGSSNSAFQQTLGEAGSNLQLALQEQRQALKDRAIHQLLNMGQLGLSGSQTPYIQGGQQGLFSQLAPATAQGVQTMAQRGDFKNVLDWLSNKLGGGSGQPATSAGVTNNFAMPQRSQLPSFSIPQNYNPNRFTGFI